MKAETKYWSVLIATLVIGGFLALSPGPHWLLMLFCPAHPFPQGEDLLRRLGEALFIAGLLALLLDTAIKDKLLTEFAHDVSIHIIGQLLPPDLRDHIRDYLETPFVRPKWTITCEIKPIRESEIVELTITSSYNLENLAWKKRRYTFGVDVERSWFQGVGVGKNRIESLDFGAGTIRGDQLATIDGASYKDDEHGNITFRKDVQIQPHAAPKSFQTTVIQYYRDQSFSPFLARSLVRQTVVSVQYPAKQFKTDLDLTFEADIPKPTLASSAGMEKWEWTIDEPILPGQGFFVRWNRL